MAKAKNKSDGNKKLNTNAKKRTSIGNSKRSRPKHKKSSKKPYRGQGK